MNKDIRYSKENLAIQSTGLPSNEPDPGEESLVGDLCQLEDIEFLSAAAPALWRRSIRPTHFVLAGLLAAILFPVRVAAADLKSETVQAWQEYVKAAEARNQSHLTSGNPFLWIDAEPAQAAKLRQGKILASPAAANVPFKVQGGLIHDWVGAIFIPNASVPDVFRVIRNYAQYKAIYHPNVVSAEPIQLNEWQDSFSMVVMNTSFFAKSALDSEYRTAFTQLDDRRWYSVSETTRVQEVSEYGSALEHMLPEGHGTGIIWSLYSIARYEEGDGGVYIELEAIALSRDVPSALRWVVDPIVRRISKSSLVTSLQQTADAVRSNNAMISRSTDRPSKVAAPAPAGSATVRSFR